MIVHVYLESSFDEQNAVYVSIASAVTLFVGEFCMFPKHCIYLVNRISLNRTRSVRVDRTTLREAHFIQEDSVPPAFKYCTFPAAVTGSERIIHLGLCSVLRLIIKSRDEFTYLLGQKQNCLKACAEVSSWTRFCEVQMPSAIEKCLCRVRPTCFSDGLHATEIIPDEILQLESHFLTPPVVSNSCKRKHEILKSRKEAPQPMSDCSNRLKVNCDSLNKCDNIELEHIFIEGLDFILTDLVLIPCVALILSILEDNFDLILPYVKKSLIWYNRALAVPRVKDALVSISLPVFDLELNNLPEEDNSLSAHFSRKLPHIRNSEKKKVKYAQKSVEEVLLKIQASKIEVQPEANPVANLHLPWVDYPSSVHPKDGDLPVKRYEKKYQQLENLFAAVKDIAHADDTIVDFCSGGGHLGLLLAFLLPKCKVILVENKEESLSRATSRMEALGLTNVVAFQSNLDYFDMPFDIGVCLHGCGVATDLVLQKCLDRSASFVLCPCCYGAIQNTHTMTYPRSRLFQESNISYEDFCILVHVADQTQLAISQAEAGRLAMKYVDTDRLNLAESHGYRTTLCTLIPPSCSPKNNLLTGIAPKRI